MDRNGFIYFNTRLSPKNSGKADSYAWAIMILDEILPYQDVTDLKENGNQPAEFNVNLITAFMVDVKVSQSYINENGGKTGGKVGGDVALIEMTDLQKSIIDLIEADASISIDQMAVKMAVKKRTLEREIAKMKQKGYISRTGSPRSGKWEVIIPYNSVIEIV
jgi:predicted HTH transcriptional regulator